jgi:thiamine biosynthesis protein ThiS
MIRAKDQEVQWHPGLTIKEVLELLGYPNRLVYIRINGKRVSVREWDTYEIPDGAKVDVFPVVLGG